MARQTFTVNGCKLKGVMMSEFGACTEFVLEFREQLAYMEGVRLTGFTVNYRTEDVILVVRCATANGHKVAFFTAHSMIECWRAAYYCMTHKPGISWKEDKYYKRG